jgi:hypothetical protein
MSDIEKVHLFKYGFKLMTQYEVGYHQPTSLQDAITISQDYE